ncbi:MAG TPA: UvrD-helicase domain-containing protein [Gammaproteobacteria bacterium]
MVDVVSDSAARKSALDAGRSFIVQAPAGSGKTELLIQRYLRLLATVDLPEQIVAITFTRKAAAEMRRRILDALHSAATKEPVPKPHLETTRALALAALDRSAEREWHLLMHPQRLRIDTLDALNAWLAHRLPLLSGGASGSSVSEDARDLYLLATRRTVAEVSAPDDLGHALRRLLHRLDNDYERLERILADLLPRRDQWLPHLQFGSDTGFRARLEESLGRLVEERLLAAAALIPREHGSELADLMRHAARYAGPEYAGQFAPWLELNALPAAEAAGLPAWRGIPNLLLTKQGGWRKRLGADIGFGSGDKTAQQRLRDLIAALSEHPDLCEALGELRSLPAPEYHDSDWDSLTSLRRVLHRLTAELRVVFTERQAVDFVEIARAAQAALGEFDMPSDLLLALDRRIRHILVDEYQDTSHAQFDLLALLTEGWERGDGRTLFLVGDPMQSIYRFRNADVSLFLKTKLLGIAGIDCESLVLSRNFRSAPAVVDWVNATFARAFPAEDDIGAGSAKFAPCVATLPQEDAAVELHALRRAEADAEIDRVASILDDERRRGPESSIAVLVQSRTHLAGLQELLRARNLDVHAVELEAPSRAQVVQDLLGLTRSLLHRADRVAWLGVLRAPWCGLTWSDLERLTGRDPDETIWGRLNEDAVLDELSADGRERARRIRTILCTAFERRGGEPLAPWIERVWRTLGGPACLSEAADLQQAERYFARLNELERRGDIDDPATLESFFSDPRGQFEVPRESGIEIMTIHRAKGLEFDTVVLLGLARVPRPEPSRALYWLERVASGGEEDLLLAPVTAADSQDDALVQLLRTIEKRRDAAERTRLLYVAATRARKRLHLVARLDPDKPRPDQRSLLARIWPSVEAAFERGDGPDSAMATSRLAEIQPVLRRLSAPPDFDAETLVPDSEPQTPLRPEFAWAGPAALQVGVVVHETLQRIAEDGMSSWNAKRIDRELAMIRARLELLGVESEELAAAVERVREALLAVLDDPTGRWLLDVQEDAQSELPVTLRTEAGLEHLRLDRTFIDRGTRWIVDFKSSTHEGGSRSEFLDSEQERYRDQLDRYAAAMRSIDDRPIRVGLYFPLLREFRNWDPGV